MAKSTTLTAALIISVVLLVSGLSATPIQLDHGDGGDTGSDGAVASYHSKHAPCQQDNECGVGRYCEPLLKICDSCLCDRSANSYNDFTCRSFCPGKYCKSMLHLTQDQFDEVGSMVATSADAIAVKADVCLWRY